MPSKRPMVFLDTETTGLDPRRSVILEVGIVKVTPDLQVMEEYEALIDPRSYGPFDVDPEALRVNGLSLEHLAQVGRPAGEVALKMAGMFDGSIVAGHSVSFDWECSRALFERTGVAIPKADYQKVDTKSLAWPLYARGEIPDAKLTTVSAALGLSYPVQHRALADAKQALEVYKVLVRGMRLERGLLVAPRPARVPGSGRGL